jgi:membrane-associated phospholipid phosphatase
VRRELATRAAIAALVGVTACGADSITSPSPTDVEALAARGGTAWSPYADGATVLRWNALARDLVARRSVDPPRASRAYALLAVAQHRAIRAALDERADGGLGAGRRGAPSPSAAMAAASARVLAALFPGDLAEIGLQPLDVAADGDADAGRAIGYEVAEAVLAQAATDGSSAIWTGTVPTGPGRWFSSVIPTPLAPLLPLWGEVRPWAMSSGDQFRAPPPPAFGTPEFESAVAEVRYLSEHRTPEQLASARFWADGGGTSTPAGHWNAIAESLLLESGADARRAAHVLAMLNVALMDAGIACWDSKYTYWLIRPSQVDPAIDLPVGLPNFPSYVSGHSTFSGAAAEVLAAAFPSRRSALQAMAEEAALSRLYGGIHYRFDSDAGLDMGRRIGQLVLMLDRQRKGEW